jgi:cytochrome c-type biogenesis protein CcmH
VIWLSLSALALVALLPLAFVLLRPSRARGRAEADLALYRAQLEELDREREAGRLDDAAHAAARLEVQRRILAAPAEDVASGGGRSAAVLGALVFLLPAVAMGIYLIRGVPEMPSATLDERRQQQAAEEQLLAALRERIARADPTSEAARQGQLLLGNAERNRGRLDEAAAAWRAALAARFDPQLAGNLAELEIERNDAAAAGALLARALGSEPGDPRLRFLSGLAEARAGRSANARSVWQALLADAPRDAPWRSIVERQLQTLP